MSTPIQTRTAIVPVTRPATSAQPPHSTLALPPNPVYRNIRPSHLEALEALGYTEAEARFLYIVATHSGYFTARQFLSFTGAHWGKRTTSFWNKLHTLGHARTECFPKGGVAYHLFSRRLYRQIEKENLRNRREHEFDFIKRRIAILDFVLLNLGYQYLETEPEKLRFFCGTALQIGRKVFAYKLPSLPSLCGLALPGDSQKNVLVPRFFLPFSFLNVP